VRKGNSGFNGQISAIGYGKRRVRCMGLVFGLGIIANSGSQSKNRRSFYSVVTTGSSFTITIGFVSYEEREDFGRWMRGFMEDVSDGRASSGFMTIQVPNRKFFRTAVPGDRGTGIVYGEAVGDMGYTLELSFVGASDPIKSNLSNRQAGLSYFKMPKNNDESRYFYPAGRQVAGAESLDGTIFDPGKKSGGQFTQPIEEVDEVEDLVGPGFVPDDIF
jgi:hypothetical protein